MKIRANILVGGVLLSVVIAAAAVSLIWTPQDPLHLNLQLRFHPPSLAFPFGTDEFGRDVLSRIMVGAATSLMVALATVLFAIVIGTVIGLISGYTRGVVDRVVTVVNDSMLAFPGLLLALGTMTIVGGTRYGIVLALSLAYTPPTVRLVRGSVLSLREKEYIEASRVIGNSELYTVVRHVMPNCLGPIIVLATSMLGWVVLAESALSFLGLGVPPPAATWGNMLASARPYIASAAWLGIAPGICISLTLLGANLLGDGLRDWLDPRMERR